MRRAIAMLLLIAATSCSGVQKLTDVLTSPPTPSLSPSPSESPSPTASSGGRPAIVVTSPLPDTEIVSPVAVRGTADVFEGAVSLRLLDATGQELAATNVRASCGTGCRGKFAAALAFFTPTRQPGTLEVFEISPKDGSIRNLVRVTVTLVPGS